MATIKRFSSVQTYAQTEYNSEGILSETTWSLLDKLTSMDGVAAISSAIEGIPAPVTVTENPKMAAPSTPAKSDVACVCASMKPSAAACSHLPYVNTYKCWVDKCPFCGGPLSNNPKHVPEGEWTCTHCDADFDGVCGAEKRNPPRKYLTTCPGR